MQSERNLVNRLLYVSFIALALIVVGLVSATVVGRLRGMDFALEVYHSPVMTALWGLCAVAGLAAVIYSRKAMTAAGLSLHLSFLLILTGAAVTHFCGEYGTLTIRVGESASEFALSDGNLRHMPFVVTLKDCGVEYHPGTRSPSDYYATVAINGDSALRQISMNRTLETDGYRFCLSSLGEQSSTFRVSHDPLGIGLTFAGYGVMFISMLISLICPGGRFRLNLRRLTVVGLMIAGVFSIGYAEPSHTPKTLQRPLAGTLGRLCVSDGGRVRPLQSFARDFCLTVCGDDRYKELTPEQVLAGWLFYYDEWKHEPMIRLKSRQAREAMGGKRFVSLSELYAGGAYKLQPLMDASVNDRELMSDDNRVALVVAVCTGKALVTLPVRAPDGTLSWFSWADRIPVYNDTARIITGAVSTVYRDISHGRFRHADSELMRLCSLQRAAVGDEFPSEASIGAERLYNATFCPRLLSVVTLLTGIIALISYLYESRRLRYVIIAGMWCVFVYVSYILALRWVAGGHVPLATGYETMLALAWISMALSLWCGARMAVVRPLGFIVAGVSLLVSMMGGNNPAIGSMMPVLGSRLLSLHVMLVMTSYALFGIMAVASVIGICSSRRRQRIAILCSTLLVPAIFLLGAGIFTGAIWANQSWGRYWGWDPKETWALVTFFIYSFPLHQGALRCFSSQRPLLIYLAAAFLSVVMTYLGVNYLMDGLHSYGAA